MRSIVSGILVVATLFAGIVGVAFADQGDFDAPAHDKQIVTGTASDVRLDAQAGPLFASAEGNELESKRIDR